jgi:hypothetical protein
MSGYAVAWIVTILGIALLGEATRRAGEGSGGRVVAWFVLFVGVAFVGGMAGGLMASAW